MLNFLKKHAKSEEEQKNWYDDKYQSVLVQRNIFAISTLVCLLITLTSVFAIGHLAPLKSVEPFVIQIDEKSGVTEVVEPQTLSKLRANEALDNYFVWQYVRAHETFDALDNYRNREIVRVMSSPMVYREFLTANAQDNPQSPIARVGPAGKRYASDPTLTYIEAARGRQAGDEKIVRVRFLAKEVNAKGTETAKYMAATLSYNYVEVDLRRAERLSNPLGFQVFSYRIEEESVTP